MIDAKALLADLQGEVTALEDDLRERCGEVHELDAALRAEFEGGRAANRTAQSYEQWREGELTQAAVHWILGCVFVRFMEDNGLVERPYLAGPGDALRLARDRHTLYFQQHPTESDREYLYAAFREVAALPAAKELFDERHNPLWRVGLSGDGATRLLEFWQRIDPSTGVLVHDFTDPDWGTRFLGDLYQDLSEAARKSYALLQTPEFVEEFILDRTLTPAIEGFGFREVRLIDPTCGSGHFLLGAFRRLFDLWTRSEPATNVRDLARRVLEQVCGVDVNPFAVAIARFRLLVAALRASEITRLADAPAFRTHVAAGDSLLHGPRLHRLLNRTLRNELGAQLSLDEDDPIRHVYAVEDADALRHLLGRQYHAVVGNPPYITVKDKALNEAYRDRYGSCSGKYALAVPFMERFFELALAPTDGQPAGHVGMITANSFMKREFGKKLIEEFIPRWDLTHVIDTSGAYIPGHGTPTVILFGRNRAPIRSTIRAVMGIRGEPSTPYDPAKGLVWTAIVEQVDQPGSQSAFVSVDDKVRAAFHAHPWSIGGGGAAELKEQLDEAGEITLGEVADSMGFAAITGEDDAFVAPERVWRRAGVPTRPFGTGDLIRDWRVEATEAIAWMYDADAALSARPLSSLGGAGRHLWPCRTSLRNRLMFGKYPEESGLQWYEYRFFARDRFRTPLSITFAFVATHNHFVLDRGGKVFKQSAPVIKLAPDATEDEHFILLGLLNSSTACFWMKESFHSKGGGGINEGLRGEKWEQFFEFDGTKLRQFPIRFGDRSTGRNAIRDLAVAIGAAMSDRQEAIDSIAETAKAAGRSGVDELATKASRSLATALALQEELDWECYRLYGLVADAVAAPPGRLPGIRIGERAFEIAMARSSKTEHLDTRWFERHRATPITEAPQDWSPEYRAVVERRIQLVETDRNVGLIEQPNHKRRWSTDPWEEIEERAVRCWLLDRLEDLRSWPAEALTSCARLAERVRQDVDFMKVAEVFRGRQDFDVAALVTELVGDEGVPFLPVLRYRDVGLRKRARWEETWRLQRLEDAAAKDTPDPVERRPAPATIPVPPKYASSDFLKSSYWRLRGKLDVPKERFVLYPHCERAADATPVIGWAGWDFLQQAQALAAYYVEMKEQEGWTGDRLTPLLAGLLELLPWIQQWHNDIDPSYGVGMGDYFRDFIGEEARALSLTLDQIRSWVPPARPGRGRKAKG